MTTTFRVDTREALVTVLTAQKTATPTLLKAVWPTRPGNFNELPCAYVASLDEEISWDAGTRTRDISGAQVALVDNYRGDSGQEADVLDQLVDALVDRFNDVTSTALALSILELRTVNETELAETNGGGQTTYRRAVLLGFRARRWEGRD